MANVAGDTESATRRVQRRLSALLFVLSLMFWGLIFDRSILAIDDMSLILRGRSDSSSMQAIWDMFHRDVFVQNGRIADSMLSLVATMGEPAARTYFAVASALLFPTALIWLTYLIPRSDRTVLPVYVLPLAAASLPWLMLALDRRLISQLVLFGAASSGYFTGLFLVTVGLVPVLGILSGRPSSARAVVLAAVPLLIGVMFHEVLAALVLGALLVVVYMAARRAALRRHLVFPVCVMVAAVVLKAATPGLWSRAADADQRQFSDASLLARTDLAIAFALVAFIPLLGYVAGSLALSLPGRGMPMRRLTWLALAGVVMVVVGLGYRVAGEHLVNGLVTVIAVAALALAATALRGARAEAVELVAVGAMAMALCVPVYGGLLPGRAWFFAEFMALLIATSSLTRVLAHASAREEKPGRIKRSPFLAVALLGSGVVVAPTLGYELLDKVNDNYAWRAHVASEVAGQADGSVEIPWTYQWNDMRPSFALDDDHEAYEDLARAYFGILDETELVWTGSIDWSTD